MIISGTYEAGGVGVAGSLRSLHMKVSVGSNFTVSINSGDCVEFSMVASRYTEF